MIAYRCKRCYRKYFSADVIICEQCNGNEFFTEDLQTAPSESTLPPLPETLNSRSDDDSQVSHFFDPNTSQVLDELSEYFRENPTSLDTSWPENENTWNQTQTSHLTESECHRNEDAEASNFSSQHIPMEPEHFSKNPTALDTLWRKIENAFDQTETSNSAAIECHRNEDSAEASNLPSQQVVLEQEQWLNPISEHHTEMNMSFQIIRDVLRQTQTSRVQDNEARTRSNLNYVEGSTSFRENPQNLMNFYDQQSDFNRENHPSIEMMIGQQTITESSQIESQLDSSFPSASTSFVSQFVPETSIVHRNASDTRNEDSSCFPDLFSSIGHSSFENFPLQQGAHSSETPTAVEGVDNFATLRALLVKRRAPPAPRSVFECRKCSKKFTDKSLLTIHEQTHETFKCKKCPEEFETEGELKEHYLVHKQERRFKCGYCSYAGRRRAHLNEHMRRHHQCTPSKRKWICGKCSRKFRKESLFQAHVRSDCDPKPFKCDRCPLQFISEIHLEKHYVVHTGEKPFKCGMCDHVCSFQSSLIRHIKTFHK